MTERINPRDDSFFSSLIKDSFKMNESFKTDPSLATSARAAKESGSYLCASNVTPTPVRFIVSVFLCLLCSCRMSSALSEKSAEKKTKTGRLPITHYKQKPAGSDLWPVNRCIPSIKWPWPVIIDACIGCTGEDILKNVDNQTVLSPLTSLVLRHSTY